MSTSPIRVEVVGSALELTLDRPKANILDLAMMAALREGLLETRNPAVKAVLLRASGPHFSFGASVDEHRPEHAPKMLAGFHQLLKELLRLPVPCIAAVRGNCLGGALELVLACSYTVASPDARLGQPEIKLAAFAPFASFMLPQRIGQGRAERLLLSGESLDAPTALAWGLVDDVADHPEESAHAWIQKFLAPLSRVAISQALGAARQGLLARLDDELTKHEARYANELLTTHDGREGIAAFLEKRAPRWENR